MEPFSVVGEFAYFLPEVFLPFFVSHVHASRHKFFYIIYAGEKEAERNAGGVRIHGHIFGEG